MKVFIVSPSRSISKAWPSQEIAHQVMFLAEDAAHECRDNYRRRYGVQCEVYEVEARITRKVPCRVAAGP